MKHILYATDFSDNSENALRYALDLLKDEACYYTLLHVIPFVYPNDEVYDYSYIMDKNEVEDSLEDLGEKYEKQLLAKGSFFETKIESGSVAQVIADYADRKQMDLIVIGTKGASRKNRIFVGSITASLVKKTHCPMLVIPEKSVFKKPKKILFALDFSNKINEKSLQPLIFIAQKYKSEILLLQVKKDEEDTISEAVLGLQVNSSLEGIDHSYKVVHDKDIPHRIEQFSKESESDVIVLISQHHNLFERIFHKSITKEMILHSSLPMLILNQGMK